MADDQDPPVKIPLDSTQRDDGSSPYTTQPESQDEKTARMVTEQYNRTTGGDVPKKYRFVMGALLLVLCVGIVVTAYLLFKDAF